MALTHKEEEVIEQKIRDTFIEKGYAYLLYGPASTESQMIYELGRSMFLRGMEVGVDIASEVVNRHFPRKGRKK